MRRRSKSALDLPVVPTTMKQASQQVRQHFQEVSAVVEPGNRWGILTDNIGIGERASQSKSNYLIDVLVFKGIQIEHTMRHVTGSIFAGSFQPTDTRDDSNM